MSKVTLRDPDHLWLFSSVRLPGILESDEAATLLGVPTHTIPILIAARHLKPLGSPGEKASKKFSADAIAELAHDPKWQDRAVRLIEQYWAKQNEKKRKEPAPAPAEAA